MYGIENDFRPVGALRSFNVTFQGLTHLAIDCCPFGAEEEHASTHRRRKLKLENLRLRV